MVRLNEAQVNDLMLTLPERFADRVRERDLRWAVSARNAGEWLLATSDLLIALHDNEVTISTRERDHLRDLVETCQAVFRPSAHPHLDRMPGWLAGLQVTPSLADAELAGHLTALADHLADRLPAQDAAQLRVPPDEVEESVWRDAADCLMATLVTHQIPVTPEERDEIWLVLDAADLPRQPLDNLPTSPDAPRAASVTPIAPYLK